MSVDIAELNEKVKQHNAFLELLISEFSKVVVGQKDMLDRLLIGLLGSGHILLEGVPGLAKTLAIKSLSSAIDATFQRIQFTPDILPSDVIGTQVYNNKTNDFSIKKGPVFGNFILADEINRAPAKVQSALLEAMQERQVTIGEETFKLEEPFLVLATQNPLEQEGTYPLPEAQLDRFMLKVVITYPKMEEERKVIRRNMEMQTPKIPALVSKDQIIRARKVVREVYMDERLENYILNIVFATRFPKEYKLENITPYISCGVSPRGSINLVLGAKVFAFMKGRGYVTPDDVKNIVYDVLRHRIGITYEAEAENITSSDIIDQVINAIDVP